MSVVHKVIILNKPLKIFEFSPLQWLIMASALAIAFFIGTKLPPVKVGGLPLGFLVGMTIVSLAIIGVKSTEIKPWQWWRNFVLYKLILAPRVFVPRLESAPIYPDANIIEEPQSKERQIYIAAKDSSHK